MTLVVGVHLEEIVPSVNGLTGVSRDVVAGVVPSCMAFRDTIKYRNHIIVPPPQEVLPLGGSFQYMSILARFYIDDGCKIKYLRKFDHCTAKNKKRFVLGSGAVTIYACGTEVLGVHIFSPSV